MRCRHPFQGPDDALLYCFREESLGLRKSREEVNVQTQIASNTTRSDDELDLLDVARMLWRHRVLVFVTTLVPALLVGAFVMSRPKVYVAEATLLPSARQTVSSDLLLAGLAGQMGPVALELGGFGKDKSPSLTEYLMSRGLAARVAEKSRVSLNLPPGQPSREVVDQVKERLSVENSSQGRLLSIKVTAPTPDLAASLANAYVSSLQEVLDERNLAAAAGVHKLIERHLGETKLALVEDEARLVTFRQQGQTHEVAQLQEEMEARKSLYKLLFQQREAAVLAQSKSSSEFQLLDPAFPPKTPKKSKLTLLIPIAAVVGLTFGMLAAFVRERLGAQKA
ncbi:cryptic autophosphorylating protein tyrosine kinase Etk [compost metagenome]